MQSLLFGILTALALVASTMAAAAQTDGEPIIGRATVVDGDTIQIRGVSIRLWGIDTPESAQTCTDAAGQRQRVGQKASFALQSLIGERSVSCTPRTKDRYGRTVAVCSVDDEDLSRRLIADGWGWAFVQYSSDYVADETAARASKANIWSMQCTAPWDWRREQRESAAPVAPQGGGIAGEVAFVSAAALNIRECPSTSCAAVDRVTQGVRLIVNEREGVWARVSTPGGYALGWASGRYLAETYIQAVSVAPAAPARAAAAGGLTDTQIRRLLVQESLSGYYGSCPCPYNVDRGGRSCGRRSAYSRPGGAAPLCYPGDVSAAMIQSFRSRNQGP